MSTTRSNSCSQLHRRHDHRTPSRGRGRFAASGRAPRSCSSLTHLHHELRHAASGDAPKTYADSTIRTSRQRPASAPVGKGKNIEPGLHTPGDVRRCRPASAPHETRRREVADALIADLKKAQLLVNPEMDPELLVEMSKNCGPGFHGGVNLGPSRPTEAAHTGAASELPKPRPASAPTLRRAPNQRSFTENTMAADLRKGTFRLATVPSSAAHIYMQSTYRQSFPRRDRQPEVTKLMSLNKLPTAVV